MRLVDYVGRGIGAISGATVAVLWMLGLWVPDTGFELTGISFVVGLLMAFFALLAVIASVRGHPIGLVVLFVASFLPVGLALLDAESWIAWIGRLNVAYLLAAALIWLGRRGSGSRAVVEANAAPRQEASE